MQKLMFFFKFAIRLLSSGHARIRGGGKLQHVDLSPEDEFQLLADPECGMRLSVSYMGRHVELE
jgi:hypothetical protein